MHATALASHILRTLMLAVMLAFSAHAQAQEPRSMDALDAHTRSEAGNLVLVDIRTPEEWRRTGIGQAAHPLSMLDRDFLARLDAILEGDRTRPLALICASGVRSALVARALPGYGFTHVYDVSEGMTGSRAGPGWVARKLPVRQP
ncbi:MAG: rhodanese-like domain-containing protein [Rhodobiaceae bacterium]|nr:rhodanese-like domain-containing protein [Rhodobiaceae bacterium]MCC0017128.1 rhodanese-like domain-containing protein [Rhodobiaceae bacterium]MCC0041938.1 rhodanese-like domain-containing protein [Rhodobiaceae bacterium]